MIEEMLKRTVTTCAATPIFARPGVAITLADGCVPLLVDFTAEDKSAKGLRKAPTGPRPVQHFSALEVAAEAPLLLLLGDAGSGKTVFARRLALHLAGEALRSERFNLAALGSLVPRGEADGSGVPEAWNAAAPLPLPLTLRGPTSLAAIAASPEACGLLDPGCDTPLLLLLDAAETLGEAGPALLMEAAALAGRREGLRVLVLGETEVCGGWPMPMGFRRHRLLPLLPAQCGAWRARCGGGPAGLPTSPGLLSLALALGGEVPEEAVLDRWLADVAHLSPAQADTVALAAFAAQGSGAETLGPPLSPDLLDALAPHLAMLDRRFVFADLAARHLAGMPPEQAVRLFQGDPARWSRPLALLARGGHAAPLVAALAALDEAPRAALLAADILSIQPIHDAALHDRLRARLLQAIEHDALQIPLRVRAGRHLALLGDPRDLEELIAIPGGTLTMGAATPPNSTPPHAVSVRAFRLGRYPVTNALYRRFVEATGCAWISTDGLRPERANAPAVDLTWHDARACCAWLTEEWRRSGRIAADEFVRLPTEPEWEHAARGAQPDRGAAMVYPWAGPWAPARGNSEEAGLNDTCAVGLFPTGRSPFGCDDMAGQVWEWCTTLWGEDMTTPSWRYPYDAADGREALDAPDGIRRVLRGGCFSSGREKATCTYRGSLEPAGHWRGNGFRVAVSHLP